MATKNATKSKPAYQDTAAVRVDPTTTYAVVPGASVEVVPGASVDFDKLLDFGIPAQRAFTSTLKNKRVAMGLSQAQLAALIGVDQTVISGIEHRVSPRMGWVLFMKVIQGYGIPLDYALEILGVVPMKEDAVDPRIQSLTNTLQAIEDPDWLNFVLTTMEVWLQGAIPYLRRIEQE